MALGWQCISLNCKCSLNFILTKLFKIDLSVKYFVHFVEDIPVLNTATVLYKSVFTRGILLLLYSWML